MEINVFPEKFLIKMWDSLVDRGIGSLLKPWQLKREKSALLEMRKKELLELAKIKHAIKAMKITDSSTFSNLAEDAATNTEETQKKAIDTIRSVVKLKNHKEQLLNEINVAKAIAYAEDAIINSNSTDEANIDKKIDIGWLNKWQKYVESIYTEDLQQLWGKILAGETISPGKYSLRALQFISCLSKEEAEDIGRLAQYNIDGWIFRDIIINLSLLSFDYLMKMQELGLIQGLEAIGLGVTFNSDSKDIYSKAIIYNKNLIVISSNDANKPLQLQAIKLTSLGKEVLSLCEFSPHEDYLHEFFTVAIKNGFKISTTTEWSFTANNHINFNNLKSVEI